MTTNPNLPSRPVNEDGTPKQQHMNEWDAIPENEQQPERAVAVQEESRKGITIVKTANGTVELNQAAILALFPDAAANGATAAECFLFAKVCQAHGMNPFLGDAFLIKYKQGTAATIQPSASWFMQKAAIQPNYRGFKAGVIVQRGEIVEYLIGSFTLKDDELLGGWCEVYIEGRNFPIRKEVAFREYSTGRSLWASNAKPGTMIEKVAKSQAHRDAFPGLFAGLYDASEMGHEYAA